MIPGKAPSRHSDRTCAVPVAVGRVGQASSIEVGARAIERFHAVCCDKDSQRRDPVAHLSSLFGRATCASRNIGFPPPVRSGTCVRTYLYKYPRTSRAVQEIPHSHLQAERERGNLTLRNNTAAHEHASRQM